MSPVSVFSFNRAFCIAPDPCCAIPYVQVDGNTYWSGDIRKGMRYNELVSLTEYPDLNLSDSEHIVDYTYQYQYCLNIIYTGMASLAWAPPSSCIVWETASLIPAAAWQFPGRRCTL